MRKRLRDASDAEHEIQAFCHGETRASFLENRMLQVAVERLIDILGEALRQAELRNPDVADRIPDMRDVVGTRNRIMHGHGDVNLSLVWDMVDVYIPALTETIDALVDGPPPEHRP